jgi:hypothetical protein
MVFTRIFKQILRREDAIMKTINTQILKSDWTDEHYKLYETIPQQIRDLAGDLFEIRWYGFGGLEWELEHNLLGSKEKSTEFMKLYNLLTTEQRNLIYYAYEA